MSKFLMAIGMIAGALVGVLTFYFFIWVMAYPALGEYCKVYNTVKTSKLEGHSGWTGDRYTTTFIDGSQKTTGYVKPGQTICADYDTHFWFWSGK